MSFLTDDDVNKRARNLFVALENAIVPQDPSFRLLSALGNMTYAAVYAAAQPGVVGIGGTWNPANAGDNAVLTEGNALATFPASAIGSCVGTVAHNPNPIPACWEIEIVGIGSGGCAGEYLGNLFLFDRNAYAGGRFNSGVNISFYQTNGIVYNFEDVETPLIVGDVLGIVVSDPQTIQYFLNGVLVNTQAWGGTSAIPMCASGAAP